MELFVGLDVSVRTTSVCVMDASGKLVRETVALQRPGEFGVSRDLRRDAAHEGRALGADQQDGPQ